MITDRLRAWYGRMRAYPLLRWDRSWSPAWKVRWTATVTIWIIVNPAAGGGRAAHVGQTLRDHLGSARLVHTVAPGDATRLARQARREGARVVVPVGGDGTVSQCVTGLCLDENGSLSHDPPDLALLPAGTGGDFRRSFSIGDSVAQAVTRIDSPHLRPLDVGVVRWGAAPTTPSAFVNVLSFGLGGLTDRLIGTGPKWLGGRLTYLWGAVRATLAQQTVPIELKLDGQLVEVAPFSNVALCNGQYFGGGMHICPSADPSDGWFDVVTMELPKPKTLALSAKIYRGTHLKTEGVRHYRCRSLEARTTRPGESLIDIDGEQVGALPLRVELLRSALRLRT